MYQEHLLGGVAMAGSASPMAAADARDGSADRNDARSCGCRGRGLLPEHSHRGVLAPSELSADTSLAASSGTDLSYAPLHQSSPAKAALKSQHAASTPSLSDLCSYTRIYPEYRTLTTWMVLLFYAPVGVMLLAMRLLITTSAAMLIAMCPSPTTPFGDAVISWVFHGLAIVAGMRMSVDGDRSALAKAKLIVANHVSQLDAVPLRLLSPLSVLLRETYMRVAPIRAMAAAGFAPLVVPTPGAHAADAERRKVRDRVLSRLRASDKPLLVYPEGAITNGRRGCMRFSAFVFGLGVPVQPVAIRVWTPLPLEQDTVWDPLWKNLLFMLFQPVHCWHLSILPAERARETESAEAFALRVAKALCDEVGIEATEYTTQDKAVHLLEVKALGKSAFLHQ